MKTALLSGSSGGVGRAAALLLSERGYHLALVGRASPEQRETLAHLSACGGRFNHFECDLELSDAIEQACQAAQAQLGSPDVIIHCAGAVHRAPAWELSSADWDRQFAVNVKAGFLICRTLLHGMLERRSGRLIFVGSISSTLGTRHQTAYNASKWAVVGFMKSLAEDLKDTGLMTVAVLPGSVSTPMLEGSGFSPRMSAQDVAKTLVYFAVDAPLAHNGSVVEMFGV